MTLDSVTKELLGLLKQAEANCAHENGCSHTLGGILKKMRAGLSTLSSILNPDVREEVLNKVLRTILALGGGVHFTTIDIYEKVCGGGVAYVEIDTALRQLWKNQTFPAVRSLITIPAKRIDGLTIENVYRYVLDESHIPGEHDVRKQRESRTEERTL